MSTFHHCCAKIRGFSSTETAIEPDATPTPFRSRARDHGMKLCSARHRRKPWKRLRRRLCNRGRRWRRNAKPSRPWIASCDVGIA